MPAHLSQNGGSRQTYVLLFVSKYNDYTLNYNPVKWQPYYMCTHYIIWVTVKMDPCQIGPKRKPNHTG